MNPLQYTAREDDGTGLYYYRARYYSPEMRRFITEDPIGLEGDDVNFFAYVWNDPIDWSDPEGLKKKPPRPPKPRPDPQDPPNPIKPPFPGRPDTTRSGGRLVNPNCMFMNVCKKPIYIIGGEPQCGEGPWIHNPSTPVEKVCVDKRLECR
jgi:RHS repeat-associated protein